MKAAFFFQLCALVTLPVLAMGCAASDDYADDDTESVDDDESQQAERENGDDDVDGVATTEQALPAAGCVSLHTWTSRGLNNAYIINKCRTTKRVRIIWRFAPDSPCYTFRPGARFTDRRSQTRWDKSGKVVFINPYVTEVRAC
jgi:hypothetical protein